MHSSDVRWVITGLDLARRALKTKRHATNERGHSEMRLQGTFAKSHLSGKLGRRTEAVNRQALKLSAHQCRA